MAALVLATLLLAGPADTKLYQKDMAFALKRIDDECGKLIKKKEIAWAKLKRRFRAEARKVRSREEHWLLLWKLVVSLKDGHADVYPTAAAKGLEWPDKSLEAGAGMEWFNPFGKRYFVLRVSGDAERSGVEPGMEVLAVDGLAVDKWVKRRTAELAQSGLHKMYTPHQAKQFVLSWGLGGTENSRLKVQFKGKKYTVTRKRKMWAGRGPIAVPKGLKWNARVGWTTLPSGYGYIWITKVPDELPAILDQALAEIGEVPGMILDFRANGGGGCDHDAVLGRFIPKGKSTTWGSRIRSAGPNPYGGPVVAIVDSTVVSAGETVSGMFKENGRGWVIGPCPTAGMSGAKTEIELPSGLFKLRVTTRSHKGRFNGGKGVEGLGVPPQELVMYRVVDLEKGVDSQIRRAEELLQKPLKKVPYQPHQFGWKPPADRNRRK